MFICKSIVQLLYQNETILFDAFHPLLIYFSGVNFIQKSLEAFTNWRIDFSSVHQIFKLATAEFDTVIGWTKFKAACRMEKIQLVENFFNRTFTATGLPPFIFF